MERLGSVAEMQARLRELQEQHKAQWAEAVAALPPGTCAYCLGKGTINAGTRPCPECGVVESGYADGTPYEFQSVHLSNYVQQDGNHRALVKARAFLDANDRRDLYLTGGVGAGKTRLACSLLNDAKKRGKWCFFARVPALLHQMQPGKPSEELEHKLMRCDLIVLDDIGAERDQASDYTRRTLLMIYEERGDRGHRTILTSNKTLQQLAEMQDDDRLASRIAGRADVVQLTTADQRMARRTR